MKRKIGLAVLTCVVIAAVAFGIGYMKKADPPKAENISAPGISKPGPPLSFSVIGDIHTDTAALEIVLRDLWNVNPGMDGLVLNGDIVDEGSEAGYAAVKECLAKNRRLLPEIVIKNIGNHEFFDYAKGPNNASDVAGFIAKYLDFSGEQKVYHDRWVKGYHFISLGSEQTYTAEINSVQAFLSEEQLQWLTGKLSEDYTPGRPIFVFLHQPLATTKQTQELQELLSKYAEVILFSSHTHTYLELNNMAYATQPFPAVYTGAVHSPLRWESKEGRRTLTPVEGSQGIYVEVDDSQVVVRGRDFRKGAWIDDAVFTLALKPEKAP